VWAPCTSVSYPPYHSIDERPFGAPANDTIATLICGAKKDGCCLKDLKFGDMFLDQLPHSSFIQHYYDTPAEALRQVRKGNSWGAISIPPLFSLDLVARFAPNLNGTVDPAFINGSTMTLNLDESNEQIATFIIARVQQAFQDVLLSDIATPCCENLKLIKSAAQNPVQTGTPVYGFTNPKFTDFIAPGMIITIAFAQAIGLTAATFTQVR